MTKTFVEIIKCKLSEDFGTDAGLLPVKKV